ncbi:hypothetical protein FRC06_000833 [Ceratobasidium sp. 370]|nr:hypothetical protein FRC06_000833 [Ceratobasidium sp. 370]
MSLRAHKIFDIPELVKLVQAYLSLQDSVRFARSSHQLFQTIMPSLWEYVSGMSQVIALLPALNHANKRKRRGETPGKTLTENDFSRFDVYAPWVKHLEICNNQQPPPKVQQMDTLFQHSTMRVLLPNLKSITCTNTDGSVDLIWVLPFLSPSLLHVEFATTNFTRLPDLSIRESSVLLHILAQKCPKLQTLSIPAKADKNRITPGLYAIKYVSDDDKAKVKDQFQLGLGPFIALIHPLVNFTSSTEILNAACLGRISTWSSLESLTITMDPQKRDYVFPKLSINDFPALKHLAFYQIPDMDTSRMIWSTSVLVKNLTSIKLLLAPKFFSYSNTKLSDTLAELLSILAEQSPFLKDLWLRLLDPELDRPSYDVPLVTLDALHKLPLQKLYIEGINFADYPFDDDDIEDNEFVGTRFAFVKHFATCFPALTELGFPNYTVAWTDSRMFCSQMPHLESLRFDFDLGSLPWTETDLNDIPRYRRSPFRTIEANFLGICENEDEEYRKPNILGFSHEEIVEIADYLFSLWPNVQIVAQIDEGESEGRTSHKKVIALINEYLAALSSCNRDASIKYEDIQVPDFRPWYKSQGREKRWLALMEVESWYHDTGLGALLESDI